MQRALFILICFVGFLYKTQAQTVISFEDYIDQVMLQHPAIKQADLITEQADNSLLESRGSFDPKIKVGQTEKVFKDKIYYDRLAAKFEIPTWYGIELQGGLDENQGHYLNPENYTAEQNLYNVGVSLPLARGLIINQRMLAIKQAKIYQNQSQAERQLMINEILYRASIAYYNWYRYYQEYQIYASFLDNAQQRLDGIIESYIQGDKPAIDTTETRIALQNRQLQLEKAKLMLAKSRLEVSTYLWGDDYTPYELAANATPDTLSLQSIREALGHNDLSNIDISSTPKIKIYDYKQKSLKAETRLYKYNLLPDIRLSYKLLSQDPLQFSTYNINNHSSAISFSMPLLLRKERGKLRQNKNKLLSLQLEQENITRQLQNKVLANQVAIDSYEEQLRIFRSLNTDYQTMLNGENRKFQIGESSVFMVNSRESKLIENLVKEVDLRYQLYSEQSALIRNLGGNL